MINLIHHSHPVGLSSLQPSVVLAEASQHQAKWDVLLDQHELCPGVIVGRARIVNHGPEPLFFKAIRWGVSPKIGGAALLFPKEFDPHVFATENFRGDYIGAGTVEGWHSCLPLTNQHVAFGLTEDHSFPGVFVAAPNHPVGVFVAQASQRILHAIFTFRGRMEKNEKWLFEIEERVTGVCSLEIAPGASFEGEELFFGVGSSNNPQDAVAPYYAHLRSRGIFARREKNPLPKERIYCTWNYDFMDDVDEEKFFSQIPIVREHFPLVKFIQLDDGYQSSHKPGQRCMIDMCYGDLEAPFDTRRFQMGPKAVADRVRGEGFRPAIWLGLWASTGSRMLRDHPDWILRDDTGDVLSFDDWYGGTAILDPSVPGVQDYLDKMCRIVFGEWGYEGVKLDFSTFAFNSKRARFSQPGKTSIELRHELEAIFRRHLPGDGFFGWCVVAGTAQPFLTQADYFRNALDIGFGDWPTVVRIARWMVNTNLFLTEAPCLPNIDSIGWSHHFTETQWESWLNLCAISGSALEISGDLSKLPVARLQRMNKALELSDPDRILRIPDIWNVRKDPPACWVAQGAESVLIGLFNWHDTEVEVPLHLELAQWIGQTVRDAYTGEVMACPASLTLSPHASRLWIAPGA